MLFKRIKNLWSLSRMHVENEYVYDIEKGYVPFTRLVEDLGDGGAEFIGEGSHDEFIEQEREETGMKGWYDRLKRLGKTKEDGTD